MELIVYLIDVVYVRINDIKSEEKKLFFNYLKGKQSSRFEGQ